MAAASGLRIGDADREAASASLRENFAQGRLTLEEFQHRLGAVFSARTDRDLADITRDLPHESIGPASRPGGRLTAGDSSYRRDQQQDYGPGYRPTHRSRLAGLAGLVMIVLAIFVVALFLPVALFGMAISRSVLFVLRRLLFGRRGLLRRLRAWLPGRRWPF
jgi:uncharacterized membrane protein